jgi:hypothetical protein
MGAKEQGVHLVASRQSSRLRIACHVASRIGRIISGIGEVTIFVRIAPQVDRRAGQVTSMVGYMLEYHDG